jgi:hypothetical protein
MESKVLSSQENEQIVALEQSERAIFASFAKGIQAARELAAELHKIEDERLYEIRGHAKFVDYVEVDLRWDMRSVRRIYGIAVTMDTIEKAGLPLPDNESQVAELSRLELERRGPVWERVLSVSRRKDEPVTVNMVRTAVELEEQRVSSAPTDTPRPAATRTRAEPAKKGVEATLDFPTGDGKTATIPNRIQLTEKGEAALGRLRHLCGDELADSIENLSLPISERELIRWGTEPDTQLVKNLVHYVAHLRWTVAKALAYESRLIDETTTVAQLVTLARARSGHVVITHEDALITVDIENR